MTGQFLSPHVKYLHTVTYCIIHRDRKLSVLLVILWGTVTVYVRAESLNSRLESCGWPSAFIDGSQDQMDRLSAMSKLKKFQCRVLVSTDLVRLLPTHLAITDGF